MSKKKKAEDVRIEETKQTVQPVAEQKATEPKFVPDDKLQSYYSEAYVRERDRLNAMFGRLDTYPIVEEKIVTREPDYSQYVRKEEYNKKKKCCTAMTVLFVLSLVAAIVFACLKFLVK